MGRGQSEVASETVQGIGMLGPAEVYEIVEAMGESRRPRDTEDRQNPRLPLAIRTPLAIAGAMTRRLNPLWPPRRS